MKRAARDPVESIAIQLGAPFRKHHGLMLIRGDFGAAIVSALSSQDRLLLGFNGFRFVEGGIRPDLGLSGDFSSAHHVPRSEAFAQVTRASERFFSEIGGSPDLWFEFTIEPEAAIFMFDPDDVYAQASLNLAASFLEPIDVVGHEDSIAVFSEHGTRFAVSVVDATPVPWVTLSRSGEPGGHRDELIVRLRAFIDSAGKRGGHIAQALQTPMNDAELITLAKRCFGLVAARSNFKTDCRDSAARVSGAQLSGSAVKRMVHRVASYISRLRPGC